MVQLQSNVSGLGGSVGKGNRLIERRSRLVLTAQLREERSLYPVKVEVPSESVTKRFDQCKGRCRSVHLGDSNTPVEGDNGRRLQRFQQRVQVLDLLPIGL